MQEGGAKMVKLEGGAGQVEIVEFLASHDIAVCAHLGLKPSRCTRPAASGCRAVKTPRPSDEA